ncbi:hypothetical protein EDC56_3398 [Sinobacterium caligoides]|uniref:Uncharacterized protein n=1 Tax=Sinobacterium caligoides TaxID=933926 RepID=A0A3N2DFS8_9GAMM|nr:hypothetical protein [Sinobacterium caligoides]ROR98665.1 hypothetical protein EDC56_3398 [Sinobacterium caligoides]
MWFFFGCIFALAAVGGIAAWIKPDPAKNLGRKQIAKTVFVMIFLSGGCFAISVEHSEKTAQTQAEHSVSRMDSVAIGKVRATQIGKRGVKFNTAPLLGGTAVLEINTNACYWVSEVGTVLACNGVAMSWSPSIGKSPHNVNMPDVKTAIANR